ncbi:hypothetical protein EFBL_1763 [Effusibacillus lacus]|uniref:Putative aromatic acid exporter C-terminal domain-containing protein n=1 Tax=Effusibacillus lacus TaxID=1348429 RepID=A0A292YH79_9BACL|nr:hypothetical protein EFBL_1763 [Effusibacillus lacus]
MGARVVKTSIAAGLALYLASFLHYPGYTYAALIAVLATQKSLTRSFGLAKYQVFSSFIGTLGGNLAAYYFGTHPFIGAVLVYALFIIHLRLGWRDTILISIVTALNSFSTFEGELVVHASKQMSIVLIGIGCSIIVNLMAVPRYEHKLEELLNRSEGMLRGLFYMILNDLDRFDQRMSKQDFARQVKEVRTYIQEARHYAELMFEDQRFYPIKGRETQQAIRTLRQMELLSNHLLRLNETLEKVEIWVEPIPWVSRLLNVVLLAQARVFHGRPAHFSLIDRAIGNLDQLFERMDLPKNRLEFTTRASLLHFYMNLKSYYEDLKGICGLSPKP